MTTGDPTLLRGLMVPTIFGFAWALAGVSGLAGGGFLVGWAVPLALVAIFVHVASRRAIAAREPRPRRVRPGAQRTFTLVNIGQVVLILVAVFGLSKAGASALIVPAVALVVGLHFLPLARIYDMPGYAVLAVLLLMMAAAGALAYALGAGAAPVRAIVGFGAAVSMWGSCLVIARRG